MILMKDVFDCMCLGFQIKISESPSEEKKVLVQCVHNALERGCFILTVRQGTRDKGLQASEGLSLIHI